VSHATTPLSDELIHREKLCDKSHHKSHEMEVTVPASKWHIKKEKKGRKCSLYFPLHHEREGFIPLIHGWQCRGYLELQRQSEISNF